MRGCVCIFNLSIGTYRFRLLEQSKVVSGTIIAKCIRTLKAPLARLSLDSIMRHKDLIGSIVTYTCGKQAGRDRSRLLHCKPIATFPFDFELRALKTG